MSFRKAGKFKVILSYITFSMQLQKTLLLCLKRLPEKLLKLPGKMWNKNRKKGNRQILQMQGINLKFQSVQMKQPTPCLFLPQQSHSKHLIR